MPRTTDAQGPSHKITVRISEAAFAALNAVRKEKGGSVTSRAQEVVEACRNVKTNNWYQALSALETRGKE